MRRRLLPVSARGALISKAANAKTVGDTLEAFRQVEAKLDEIHRRDRIADIKVLLKRAIKSPTFPVGVKRMMMDLLEDVRLENWNPVSLDKLRTQQEFIDHLRQTGEDVVVPQALFDQIAKLSKRPLAELPTGQLDRIYDDVVRLFAMGKDVRSIQQQMTEEKRLADLAELTQGPRQTLGIHGRMGEKGVVRPIGAPELTWAQDRKNEFLKGLDEAQRLRMVVTPISHMVELIDGREEGATKSLILEPMQVQFADWLREVQETYFKERDAKLAEWGDITIQERDRVGIAVQHLQEGGDEKLYQLGLDDAKIETVVKSLSAREKAMLAWVKKMIETKTDELMRTAAVVDNIDMKKVENYFSMLTDWDAMQESADVGQIVAPQFSGYRREAEKRFLEERVAGAKQRIQLDPFKVLDIHMPAKLWYIHMAGALKEANALVKTPEYRQAAGDIGHPLMVQWLDAMARMGGVEGARRMRWLDTLRRNYSLAQIAFNPGSALVQYSSLGDGAAKIGGGNMASGLALLQDKGWQTIFDDLSPKLKYRGEGRNLYTDVLPGARIKRLERVGFAPIRFGDNLAAHAIFGGAYKAWHDVRGLKMDKAKPSKEAAAFAQEAVDASQSSPHLIDMPLILSGGRATGNVSWDRSMSQFQLFAMSRYSHIADDIIGKDWKKGNRAKAMTRLSWIAASWAYESGMRYALAAAAAAAAGEELKDRYAAEYLKAMFGSIPIIPSAIQSILFQQDILPPLAIVRRALGGSYGVASGIAQGKPSKAAKGLVDVMTGLAMMRGIPGSGVAGRMVRRVIPDDEREKKGRKSYSERREARRERRRKRRDD